MAAERKMERRQRKSEEAVAQAAQPRERRRLKSKSGGDEGQQGGWFAQFCSPADSGPTSRRRCRPGGEVSEIFWKVAHLAVLRKRRRR